MKQIFLSLGLIFVSLIGFGQVIPNAGFEDWVQAGSYSDPVSWSSLNSTLSTFGIVTSGYSTDAHTGSRSARLETQSAFGTAIPGVLTVGQLEVDIFTQTTSMTGGVPCLERPRSLKGFLKYSPLNGDSCVIFCYLTKYNEENGEPDTLATGFYITGETSTAWQPFEMMLEHTGVETPDTFNVYLVSSIAMESSPGTVLLVDDLELDFSGAPTVSLGNDTVLLVGQNLQLDAGAGAGYSYEWHKDGDLAIAGTNQTLLVEETGNYSVIVRNEFGYPALDTIQVTFVNNLDEPGLTAFWQVNPMVTNGNIHIGFGNLAPTKFSLLNPLGQEIRSGSLNGQSGGTTSIWAGTECGLFILILERGSQSASFRVVNTGRE